MCTVDASRARYPLPRIGLRFKLPKEFEYEKYDYCALGPWENYVDRGGRSCHKDVFTLRNPYYYR